MRSPIPVYLQGDSCWYPYCIGHRHQGILNLEVPWLSSRLLLDGAPFDWNTTSTPQPGLNGRVITYPRARVLGGSSSHSKLSSAVYHGSCVKLAQNTRWHDMDPGIYRWLWQMGWGHGRQGLVLERNDTIFQKGGLSLFAMWQPSTNTK